MRPRGADALQPHPRRDRGARLRRVLAAGSGAHLAEGGPRGEALADIEVSGRSTSEQAEGPSPLLRRVERAAFALTGAAMVATPLLPRGRRAVAASCVVGGLAATTAVAAARRWGPERALAAFATVAAATTLVEKL